MGHDACPYAKLNAQQIEELLQMTVWSLNEIGLRKVVMNFLGAMTHAATTGCALDHALAEQPTDPIVTEVLHLQRHAMTEHAKQAPGRRLQAVAN